MKGDDGPHRVKKYEPHPEKTKKSNGRQLSGALFEILPNIFEMLCNTHTQKKNEVKWRERQNRNVLAYNG